MNPLQHTQQLVFVNSTETVKQKIRQAEASRHLEKQFENSGKMVKKLRIRKVVRFTDFLQNYFQFKAVGSSAVFKSIELPPNQAETVETEEKDNSVDRPKESPQHLTTTQQQDSDIEWHGMLPLVNVEEVLEEWRQLQATKDR